MGSVYRTYTSNNPSGVVINPGWYALAEEILTEKAIHRIMWRWFGIKDKPPPKRKKPWKHPAPISDKIIKMYKENKKLKNIEIAYKIGCSPEMVSKALRKVGICRNRWDGYKPKRKTKKQEGKK